MSQRFINLSILRKQVQIWQSRMQANVMALLMSSTESLLRRPELSSAGFLNVQGWLAKSIDQGTLPESVLLVLVDGENKRAFIPTQRTPRPDVGATFKKPALTESGYVSNADVSCYMGHTRLASLIGKAIKSSFVRNSKSP